jgi:hypothetical protein
MTQPDTGGQNDRNDGLGVSEDEAKQLLGAPNDGGEGGGEGGDAPKDGGRSDTDESKLTAEVEKWKSLARKHEKSFKDTSSKLKQYEDASKSDLERWEERANTAESRAGTAEAKAKALEIAIERAPEHATLAQVRAVAKRVRGEDDDALEKDADELFEMLAPAPAEPKPGAKTPARPKERLKGGADPDEEPEETDPRKLAALLPRRR